MSGFAPPGDIHRVRNAGDGNGDLDPPLRDGRLPDRHERSALLRPLGRARALGGLELGGQSEAGEDLGHDERSDLLDTRTLEREDVIRKHLRACPGAGPNAVLTELLPRASTLAGDGPLNQTAGTIAQLLPR